MASMERRKAHDNLLRLVNEQKKEKQEALNKVLQLERLLDAKQKLEMEIEELLEMEELKGKLQVMRYLGDEDDDAVQNKIKELNEELQQKQDEMSDLVDLNQTLIIKEHAEDVVAGGSQPDPIFENVQAKVRAESQMVRSRAVDEAEVLSQQTPQNFDEFKEMIMSMMSSMQGSMVSFMETMTGRLDSAGIPPANDNTFKAMQLEQKNIREEMNKFHRHLDNCVMKVSRQMSSVNDSIDKNNDNIKFLGAKITEQVDVTTAQYNQIAHHMRMLDPREDTNALMRMGRGQGHEGTSRKKRARQ